MCETGFPRRPPHLLSERPPCPGRLPQCLQPARVGISPLRDPQRLSVAGLHLSCPGAHGSGSHAVSPSLLNVQPLPVSELAGFHGSFHTTVAPRLRPFRLLWRAPKAQLFERVNSAESFLLSRKAGTLLPSSWDQGRQFWLCADLSPRKLPMASLFWRKGHC